MIALAAFGLATPTYAQSNWEAVGEALGKEGAVQSESTGWGSLDRTCGSRLTASI